MDRRSLLRAIAVVVGFSLIGSFLFVSVVHLMLPQDPIRPGPTLNYIALLLIAFVIVGSLLTIAYRFSLYEHKALHVQIPGKGTRYRGKVVTYKAESNFAIASLGGGAEIYISGNRFTQNQSLADVKLGSIVEFRIAPPQRGPLPEARGVRVVN